MRVTLQVLVPLLFTIEALVGQGQVTPRLLADVAPGLDFRGDHVNRAVGIALGDQVVYTSSHDLWRTDGTASGTRRVFDALAHGAVAHLPHTERFGHRVAFVRGWPPRLWVADGTTGGTTLLTPAGCSSTAPLIDLGNRLVFVGWDAAHGTELWTSDGTPAGTGLLHEFVPGVQPPSVLGRAVVGQGVAWYVPTIPVAGGPIHPILRTDGTPEGTWLVSHSLPFEAIISRFALDDRLLINLRDGDVWSAGRDDRNAALFLRGVGDIREFVAAGTRAWFDAGDSLLALWFTDGTPSGTRSIGNFPRSSTNAPRLLGTIGGRLFFVTSSSSGTDQLWLAGDSSASIKRLTDFGSGTGSRALREAVVAGARIFFVLDEELWVSDGTVAGTRQVAGLSSPQLIAPLGDDLLFSALLPELGRELWRSDGTPAGTVLIGDFGHRALSSDPAGFTALDERTVFIASESPSAPRLWITDRDHTMATALTEPASSATAPVPTGVFASLIGRTWFSVYSVAALPLGTLWSTGGSAADTVPLLDVSGQPVSAPFAWVAIDDLALFATDRFGVRPRLVASDGTAVGTRELPVEPDASGEPLAMLGNAVWCAGTSVEGYGIHRTDGTVRGTRLALRPELPGRKITSISSLRALDGKLWFSARNPFREPWSSPWISDGTQAGTRPVIDPAGPRGAISPGGYVGFAGRTWFTAGLPGQGSLLLASDGTDAGTLTMARSDGSSILRVVAGDRLYFVLAGELWASDGRTIWLVREIQPGPTEAFITNLQPLGASSRVVFFAQDPVLGKQIFVSDGTAAGTRPVTAYPATAVPQELRVVGTRVFLSLDDGSHGREPFVFDLSDLEAGSLVTLGRACARREKTPHVFAEGTPSLGHGDFAITLADAPSHAAAWLAIGLAATPDAAHSLCAVRQTVPFETYAVLTDALGRARIGFSIPSDRALLGVALFADWSVADVGGPFLGALSQTRMLHVVVGR